MDKWYDVSRIPGSEPYVEAEVTEPEPHFMQHSDLIPESAMREDPELAAALERWRAGDLRLQAIAKSAAALHDADANLGGPVFSWAIDYARAYPEEPACRDLLRAAELWQNYREIADQYIDDPAVMSQPVRLEAVS